MIRSLTDSMIILTNEIIMESDVNLTLSDPVSYTEVQGVEENISLMTYLNIPTAPEVKFVKSVLNGCATKTLHSVLNSPSVLGAGRFQDSRPQNETITLFDSVEQDEIPMNSPNTQPVVKVSNVLNSTIDSLEKVLELISNLHDDSELQSAVIRALDTANSMQE